MTTQEIKRKLTAILSADVKGYHRLIASKGEFQIEIFVKGVSNEDC